MKTITRSRNEPKMSVDELAELEVSGMRLWPGSSSDSAGKTSSASSRARFSKNLMTNLRKT